MMRFVVVASFALVLAAPAEAAHCRYCHTARGGCAVSPHRSVRAHGHLGVRSPILPPPQARLPSAPLPSLPDRPVRLGVPAPPPNVITNLPPVNVPQPVP